MLVAMPGALATNDTKLGQWMTEFTIRVRQDTDEIYTRDRRVHARITILMEREAMMSREAWGRSMNTSDLARLEVMSLRTTTQMTEFESQQGPAKGPVQPDAPEEAGSSS
ncbi:hypothetical protein Tco_1518576 [Tanacetum coccineum]